MAPPVYSENLFRAQTLAGAATFTVPAGLKYVMRDVSIVRRTAVYPIFFSVSIPISLNLIFVTWASSADPQWQNLQGRWVLESGDVVTISTSGGQADVYISGYALTLP